MAVTTSESGFYTSKSGVEIQAVFGNEKFGDLHMIKYATQRDTANVHVMGHVDPVSVAKGKRATTGACVFAIFEKDRLLEAMAKDHKVFLTNHELANYGTLNQRDKFSNSSTRSNANRAGGTVRVDGTISTSSVDNMGYSVFAKSNFGQEVAPMLIDQIPPFDITLIGVSESTGDASRMVVHGVQFNSDQGGSSVDDLILERQVTFLARRISPWTQLTDLEGGTSVTTSNTNTTGISI